MNKNIEFDKNGNQKTTFIYKILRILASIVFKTIFPIEFIGAEKLNSYDAPFVLVSNHKSFMDPVALAAPLKKYPIHFLAKKELTKFKSFAYILKKAYMIPIDRKGTDLKAIRESLSVLKNKGVLGLFPEGTRHKPGIMLEPEGGAALLVMRSGVPVIPALINGKIKLFKKTKVFFGEPIVYDDILAQGVSTHTCELFTQRMKYVYSKFVENL
ncbi:MAG: 1-acyl-sn-glycerol-3-phosphate acyltransferase [Christensenellaceae bacterium]|nr:1-acyl-sn-glycerol-3-phosphate acyltransferase [Christensenellaceae bacterium]